MSEGSFRDGLDLLRERDLGRLFVARLVAAFGSAMAPVAMAFGVLELTGSATAMGIVIASQSGASAVTIIRWREIRSASAPPTSCSNADAADWDAITIPIAVAEPVSSRTPNAIATGAIALPKAATNRATNSRPRSRSLSRSSPSRDLSPLTILLVSAALPPSSSSLSSAARASPA